MNKQLNPLGIQVELRGTDSNRWREKLLKGSYQFMDYGWYADYPDPENFMFLLYGPNSKAKNDGENYANYENPEFDKLFKQMETMPNSPERLQIIERMLEISRHDAPWIFAWEPTTFAVHHSWVKNYKSRFIGPGCLKYLDIDTAKRKASTREWNSSIEWPVYLVFIVFISLLIFSCLV